MARMGRKRKQVRTKKRIGAFGKNGEQKKTPPSTKQDCVCRSKRKHAKKMESFGTEKRTK